MARRTSAGPTTGSPRPVPTTQPPTTRDTTVNPAQLDGDQMFPFLAQLHLSPGMYRAIYLTDDDTPVTYPASPDGSWCEITRQPDSTGQHLVREAGPYPPLDGHRNRLDPMDPAPRTSLARIRAHRHPNRTPNLAPRPRQRPTMGAAAARGTVRSTV
jgi:hypothetical protein